MGAYKPVEPKDMYYAIRVVDVMDALPLQLVKTWVLRELAEAPEVELPGHLNLARDSWLPNGVVLNAQEFEVLFSRNEYQLSCGSLVAFADAELRRKLYEIEIIDYGWLEVHTFDPVLDEMFNNERWEPVVG